MKNRKIDLQATQNLEHGDQAILIYEGKVYKGQIAEFFDNYLLDVNNCNEMKKLLDTYPNNMSLIALILLRIRIDLLNNLESEGAKTRATKLHRQSKK